MFENFANVWTMCWPCSTAARFAVALSLDKVRGVQIQSPLHGWRCSGEGANCFVPWNPDAMRQNLFVLELPARLWDRALRRRGERR